MKKLLPFVFVFFIFQYVNAQQFKDTIIVAYTTAPPFVVEKGNSPS